MDRIKIIQNYVRPNENGHITYEVTTKKLITEFLKLDDKEYEAYVNETLLPVAKEIEKAGNIEKDTDIDNEIWVVRDKEEPELIYCYYKEYNDNDR